jgi:hypothetical protein
LTKIVKSISLDEDTIHLANAKTNFSQWVREQLYSEITRNKECSFAIRQEWDHLGQVVRKDEEVCNGLRVGPRCMKCWPVGKPSKEDWQQYVKFVIDLGELKQRTLERWNEIEESNQIPQVKERKYLRRLLAFLWSWV